MPGRFINSPKGIIGGKYTEVADYPSDPPIAISGNRRVYKGRCKVYLVEDDVIVDYFDWDIYGNDYRVAQKTAQENWGIRW